MSDGPIRHVGRLRSSGPGTWTVLELDRASSARLGSRGKVRVRGTLNGRPFETSAIPNGDGTHSLLITKPIQAATGVGPGARVRVEIRPLAGPRPVELPKELSKALRGDPIARRAFVALAPSHRRAWAEHVASARASETRARRAMRAVERILAGERRPTG
jgi:bacteriocin resistance YdeI/OmpD-like protein/uncharacterized protein DUF1905